MKIKCTAGMNIDGKKFIKIDIAKTNFNDISHENTMFNAVLPWVEDSERFAEMLEVAFNNLLKKVAQ